MTLCQFPLLTPQYPPKDSSGSSRRAASWPVLGAAAALLAALASPTAQAGRPMSVDDAATAEHGQCQLEGWWARDRSDRSWVLAPACGVLPGLELGLELSTSSAERQQRLGVGPALKWAPEAGRWDTPLGPLALGLKLGSAHTLRTDGGWQADGRQALLLGSWAPLPAWTLHANLGHRHSREASAGSAVAALALVWAPGSDWLVFAEASAARRRALFGPTVQTLGGRWWWVPERFGLDVTASREAGGAPGWRWTLGFGAYGVGF